MSEHANLKRILREVMKNNVHYRNHCCNNKIWKNLELDFKLEGTRFDCRICKDGKSFFFDLHSHEDATLQISSIFVKNAVNYAIFSASFDFLEATWSLELETQNGRTLDPPTSHQHRPRPHIDIFRIHIIRDNGAYACVRKNCQNSQFSF